MLQELQKMITKGKMLLSFSKFSQLIFQGNLCGGKLGELVWDKGLD